jgi:gliding motility-associated-like protein
MLKPLHILFYVVVATLLTTAAAGQDLPSACQGSVERYWVKGFNGQSLFTWRITDPKGNVIPESVVKSVNAGSDTVEVAWNFANMPGGIYTFHIVEKTPWGCTGEEYTQNIVVNTPEVYVPISSFLNTKDNLINLCKGSTYELEVQLKDGKRKIATDFSKWMDLNGAFNVKRIISSAGTFTVKVVDDLSTCSFDTVKVISRDLPKVDLGPDVSISKFNPVTIVPKVDKGNIYSWTINNEVVSTASTYLADQANVKLALAVTDEYGCVGSDTLAVKLVGIETVRIPAAFTPNGDGYNDRWTIPEFETKYDVDNLEMEVFNRWGKQIWKYTKGKYDATQMWDGKDMNGKPLPVDSYHYIIRFKYNGSTQILKGAVTIIL